MTAVQQAATPQPRPNYQQSLYQEVVPVVRHVLEVMLENQSEESTASVASYVLDFQYQSRGGDGSWEKSGSISNYLPPKASEAVMKGRILEALAHWIRDRTRRLDEMIPDVQAHSNYNFMADRLLSLRQHMEQAHQATNFASDAIVAEFICGVMVELLGREALCLGSALAGLLIGEVDRATLIDMIQWPASLLGFIVRSLEGILAKISKVVMELYEDQGYMDKHDSKNLMIVFFQLMTVETTSGTLEVFENCNDEQFLASPFRVKLIDSFGSLLKLLCHLEGICHVGMNGGAGAAVAVDFEGVKLCRHGALCLIQMTCSDDPRLVYVLDVHVLGKRLFTMVTPQGSSMKGVLEDQNILKVWFDPRNDIDALYHQFHVMPQGIFDLQLAEVADRRNRGLNVNYVQGLHKCLTQCSALDSEQKAFAERINSLGKRLFEPQLQGCYEVFQERPLNPVILVYSAHDSRYMLMLYEQYRMSIGDRWVERVMRAGEARAQWCLSREYTTPSSEAPDI